MLGEPGLSQLGQKRSWRRTGDTHLCWLLMLRCHHQKSPLAHQACVDHLSLRTDTNMREIPLCHKNKSPQLGGTSHTEPRAHSWRNPSPEEPHQSSTAQGWAAFSLLKACPKVCTQPGTSGFPGESLIHPQCVGGNLEVIWASALNPQGL